MAESHRIALLAPDAPTFGHSARGPGAFVFRMALSLLALGHRPEVFIPSKRAVVVTEQGVPVHHVRPRSTLGTKWIQLTHPKTGARSLEQTVLALRHATGISTAVREAGRAGAFRFIHAPEWGMLARFLPPTPACPLVIRCSHDRELWRTQEEREFSADLRRLHQLELQVIRGATKAYAPSRMLAEHYRQRHGINLGVVRPAFVMDCEPASTPPADLPARYLLHYGSLGTRKGTDRVLEAARLARQSEPAFTVLLAGHEKPQGFLAARGAPDDGIRWLGELSRADLYAVLQRAIATVLPSRADNLPNSAIESLHFGVGVIAMREASLDELVEPGLSGELLAPDDIAGLAAAMLQAWRGTASWLGTGFRKPSILAELEPATAARNLLHFVLGSHTGT
jgi:glycosyltransferase involved in cell wall biosynthesis